MRLRFFIHGLLFLIVLTAFASCSVTRLFPGSLGAEKKRISSFESSLGTQSTSTGLASTRVQSPGALGEEGNRSNTEKIFLPVHSGGPSSAPSIMAAVQVQPNELIYSEPYIETASPLQLKFALLMDTEVERVPEESFLRQVDDWLGVRYRSGGNTKRGIDCSGFTSAVYASYCALRIPRTAKEQYQYCQTVELSQIRAGDFLFFKTRGRSISHVGLYLGSNKFIHASVSRGVIVSDCEESYFKKRFVGVGRIPESPNYLIQ